MYRKEIKVLDCTIRDGGLMNNHLFSDDLVRGVFQAVNQSGVDYIELGYKADENQFKRGEFGPMKFCSEKDLENVIGDTEINCKVSVMADIGRFDPKSVVPKAESYIDMMRVASYVKDIDKAIDFVNILNKKGYDIARRLNLDIGSSVKLAIPKTDKTIFGEIPRFKTLLDISKLKPPLAKIPISFLKNNCLFA